MLARKQAVVTVEQNQLNDDIIVAFVISNFSKEEIYDAIRKQLPDYMIPSKMIYLEEIPLTVNGKVDYNQLHDIFIEDLSNGTYIPVSYTHLDVYKRQGCRRLSCPARRG